MLFFNLFTVSPANNVSIDPPSLIAERGDNVTFTCFTDSGPNTTYLWFNQSSGVVCTLSNCSFDVTDESMS